MKTGIFSLQFYFHPLRRHCQRANLKQGKRFGFSFVNTNVKGQKQHGTKTIIYMQTAGYLTIVLSRTKQQQVDGFH